MTDFEEIKEKLNRNDRFCANNGIQITEIKQDYAEAVARITPENRNALGILQGGVMFTLADFAFAAASLAKAEDDGKTAVAQNATIAFIRPGTGTFIRAKAKMVNRGRQSCACDIEVFNDQDKIVAKVLITGFNFDPTKGKNNGSQK